MPTVERVSELDREAFERRFEGPELPVVIVGGAGHYSACTSWSPEYLCQRVGQVELDYKVSTSHRHPDFLAATPKEMFARERGTMRELVQKVTSGPPGERARRLFTGDERFLLQRRGGVTRVDPELGVLLEDVIVPELFDEARLYSVWGWLSGQGVRTWLHYDNNGCHNLNAQLTGSKRCTLYPPSELSRMKPFPLGGENPAYNCSMIDVETRDASLQDLDGFEAEIEAGDLLYIPRYWFHTFQHTGEFNTNVNFWWQPERPSHSPVSARQAFLDAAHAAGVAPAASSVEASWLRRLDETLCAATRRP